MSDSERPAVGSARSKYPDMDPATLGSGEGVDNPLFVSDIQQLLMYAVLGNQSSVNQLL